MQLLTIIFYACVVQLCRAWKPIVGSAGFTSSFGTQSYANAKILTPIAKESSDISSSLLHEPTINTFKDGLLVNFVQASDVPLTLNIAEKPFEYNYGGDRDMAGVAFQQQQDHCSLKKYAFNHDGVVHYKNEVPELNQFTICFWMRFTNHSADHVLLTYSVEEAPREVQFWVANAKNSSFISMAIKGQQVYRLNYPLRMRQWHHLCSSWNGKTGEWQVWLKAERIGRGFHNSLVGHKVPAHGKLFSGGPSVTGEVSEGLHFEVTLIQIYRIALSAGKAHRDHKHHHVHHFDHEGQELSTTTAAPAMINRPLPMHSLLANGQIPSRVRLNLAQPSNPEQSAPTFNALGNKVLDASAEQQTISLNTNFVNGQIHSGSRLVSQQLIGYQATQQASPASIAAEFNLLHGQGDSVELVDETETRIFFKRQAEPHNATTASKAGGETVKMSKEKKLKKRGLVFLKDGSIVDDTLLDEQTYKYEGLAEFGSDQFKHDVTMKTHEEDEVTEHDHEPAEEEVKAVMALCSACDLEPFQGAIVFAWKDAHEQMDNALKGLSVGGCANF